MKKTKVVALSLEIELVDSIERMRDRINRSKFINELIKEAIENRLKEAIQMKGGYE